MRLLPADPTLEELLAAFDPGPRPLPGAGTRTCAPPATVDALAWARERASGFGFAELLKACCRTDVSVLVAELRDAGFGKAGRAWREDAG